MDESGRAPEPDIELRQLSVERAAAPGCWNARWLIQNRGARRLQILRVRLPHGQFKSDEQQFEPAIDLEQGQEAEFQTRVKCAEPPGPVTENAFVIFYVNLVSEPWRIFVRIRVAVSSEGTPEAATESITMQKVGFAEEDFS